MKAIEKPASIEEREKARLAAIAIVDTASKGASAVAHLDLSRPRRGEWWTTWANLH